MSRKQVLIRLREGRDDALMAAIDSLPTGQRESAMRRALTWYLVPGGFRDLEARLCAISGAASSFPGTTQTASPVPNVTASQALDQAMKDFGWDDEEE